MENSSSIGTAHLHNVRAILAQRKEEILALYHAVGVGIGKEGESNVIVVYLEKREDQPLEAVSLDGVPLKFVVTGEIKLLLPKER